MTDAELDSLQAKKARLSEVTELVDKLRKILTRLEINSKGPNKPNEEDDEEDESPPPYIAFADGVDDTYRPGATTVWDNSIYPTAHILELYLHAAEILEGKLLEEYENIIIKFPEPPKA